MKRLFVLMLIGCFVVSGGLIALGQEEEIVEFYVRCWARPPMESWRGNNIVLAVAELNADLEAAGDPRRVEVNLLQDDPRDWGGYVTEFLLGYGVGEAPDIWLTGHEHIGTQAEAGRIIALDELMKEFPGFKNVIDSLWDSTSYKDKIWGVPQDAEARPLYFNMALLGELGWTANEIAALPDKIEKGEFTLYDMLAVAKEAVDKGVVADGNGFWTRPKNGPDFTAFYYAFGGETIDIATGKLVFDEAAGLKYYQFFYDAAQNYGSMACLHGDWSLWHGTITDGKVLFWVGGTWQWAEWAEQYVKELGGEDYLWENWGFGLIPAAAEGGQPNSLTHPLVYTISSQCEHPDLALALIDKVTDYGPNTRHAVASNHLGVLKDQTEYKCYKDSRMLSEALYMLAYTTFLPNNPDWGSYSTITYEALAAAVGGDLTAQEAVDFVVESLQRELGDNVIIKPSWIQVNSDGFGDPNNICGRVHAVFNGCLYVGTLNQVTGGEVWRTSDGINWTQVNIDGFGDPNNVEIYPKVVFDGNLYAGTLNQVTGVEIWRTSDGINWTQVNIDGFGYSSNIWACPCAVFSLYAGTANTVTGGEVWRTSDGTTWTQVIDNGSGDPNNGCFHPRAVFNGCLYAGTENYVTGGEIWRSSDGTTWTQVNIDGFGDPNNIISDPSVVFDGNLYAGAVNLVTGGEVWRTSDGTTWTQVNIDGFGDPNNVGAYARVVFEGNLYAGTFNEVTGCEIWRGESSPCGK